MRPPTVAPLLVRAALLAVLARPALSVAQAPTGRLSADAAWSPGGGGAAAAARPPLMNTQALSVGLGFSSGLAGAELVQRWPRLRVGTAVGAGAAGVGGRLLAWPLSESEGWLWEWFSGYWSPYVSAGFAYTPWAGGDFRASGAYGAELGMQRWGAEGSVFVDVGLGAARTTGGEWHDRRVVPTAHVALGYAWPF